MFQYLWQYIFLIFFFYMSDLNFILNTNNQRHRFNFYVHVLRKTCLMNDGTFIGLFYVDVEKFNF